MYVKYSCVDCDHGPEEHAASAEAPCEVPGCMCMMLHYNCEHDGYVLELREGDNT